MILVVWPGVHIALPGIHGSPPVRSERNVVPVSDASRAPAGPCKPCIKKNLCDITTHSRLKAGLLPSAGNGFRQNGVIRQLRVVQLSIDGVRRVARRKGSKITCMVPFTIAGFQLIARFPTGRQYYAAWAFLSFRLGSGYLPDFVLVLRSRR